MDKKTEDIGPSVHRIGNFSRRRDPISFHILSSNPHPDARRSPAVSGPYDAADAVSHTASYV
jgi:hypothetical protein